MTQIDPTYLPPDFLPLFDAYQVATQSPKGKRTHLMDLTVTVKAEEMRKAIEVALELGRREVERIGEMVG